MSGKRSGESLPDGVEPSAQGSQYMLPLRTRKAESCAISLIAWRRGKELAYWLKALQELASQCSLQLLTQH